MDVSIEKKESFKETNKDNSIVKNILIDDFSIVPNLFKDSKSIEKEDSSISKYKENADFYIGNDSRNILLKSKSTFDIGNINYNDYNSETINSDNSVDCVKKNKEKEDEINNIHSNDEKDFYELNITEMPNREGLLKELYENGLDESAEEKKIKNKKSKEVISLGKIFKRSEK